MWLVWLIVAIAFAVAELVYSGFFLIWFSAGALTSLIVSFITPSIAIQLSIFLVVSLALLLTLTKVCTKKFIKSSHIPTNLDALIHKTGVVTETIGHPSNPTGQVKLDGEVWSAISQDGSLIEAESIVTIQEVKGVKLIVLKKNIA